MHKAFPLPELEEVKLEKDGLDGKLAGLLKASKNFNHLIKSQRSDQVKEGVGYNAVPPPAADLYLSPKKDLSWTGLPEFVDDTVTDYNEPASLVNDVSKGEACPTDSGFIADQDRATIAKSSTLPHDSAPRVTSPADEGSMQHYIFELTALCTSLDDAPIKGRSINEGEAAAERISNNSKEIARVLTSMDASTVLAGGIDVPTGSGFIPTAGPPATVISTSREVSPTASPIATRRKGKEVMVESDTPKKKRLQEQINAQVARELEEQQEKENMRMNEQIARDAEVARIHAEEELQGRLMTKKQKREYYMAMIRNNLWWKVKDFKGLSFEEIEAKFAKVWK
nr:hypothetical protein [Tanacetum cinerariifolium]